MEYDLQFIVVCMEVVFDLGMLCVVCVVCVQQWFFVEVDFGVGIQFIEVQFGIGFGQCCGIDVEVCVVFLGSQVDLLQFGFGCIDIWIMD